MIDDLVKGLREYPLRECREAADRIEKLEAQLAQSQLKRWAARWEEQADRIEQLEAALRKYADEEYNGFNADGAHARKALEGKDA